LINSKTTFSFFNTIYCSIWFIINLALLSIYNRILLFSFPGLLVRRLIECVGVSGGAQRPVVIIRLLSFLDKPKKLVVLNILHGGTGEVIADVCSLLLIGQEGAEYLHAVRPLRSLGRGVSHFFPYYNITAIHIALSWLYFVHRWRGYVTAWVYDFDFNFTRIGSTILSDVLRIWVVCSWWDELGLWANFLELLLDWL